MEKLQIFILVLICLIISGILGGFIKSQFLPDGVSLSLTNKPPIDLEDKKLKEFIFNSEREKEFSNSDKAKEKFNEIKNKVKKGKIFFGDTKIKFSGSELKEDGLVSVTTSLTSLPFGLTLYSTSYERVSCLLERDNYFEFIMSGCSENIIDGYYRLKLELNDNKVKLNYSKVQSLIPGILKLFVSHTKYENINKKSVKMTIDNLLPK
jgi:hypothetical protein